MTADRDAIYDEKTRLQKRIDDLARKLSEVEGENRKLGESRRTLENRLIMQQQGKGKTGSTDEDLKDIILR